MGDEIELPLAMSWPLYQYSLRPGHCLTIFPYLLRYSTYIFIVSFFVGVYHAQDKAIISIIFCIVNVNKKGGFTALLTRKADYLLIFSSSASTNSGKAMIARIVTVSPPYIAPAGMAAIIAIEARTAQKQALVIGCALRGIAGINGVAIACAVVI